MRAFATVRFTFEGLHCWPDAPAHRTYLASDHRHLFHFEVSIEVMHDDREIEFHDLMDLCKDFVLMRLGPPDFGPKSCEHMARQLADYLRGRWPNRYGMVKVFEDGEAGAEVWIDA